jgi:hypothetical protein
MMPQSALLEKELDRRRLRQHPVLDSVRCPVIAEQVFQPGMIGAVAVERADRAGDAATDIDNRADVAVGADFVGDVGLLGQAHIAVEIAHDLEHRRGVDGIDHCLGSSTKSGL